VAVGTPDEAVGSVQDGMTVAFGGFITTGRAWALTRALIRKGVRDLTVMAGACGGLDVDMLIGAGCVRKLVAPYVGGEVYSTIGPFFQAAAERGSIEIWECDEGIYYAGLRAAAAHLPFQPVRAGVGTSLPELNPDLVPFRDPIRGELLLAVPALKPDVALLHADRGDRFGNAQHRSHPFGDRAAWKAAAVTVVQVDELVDPDVIRASAGATTLLGVDCVVETPFGAHPGNAYARYDEDAAELRAYVAAARQSTRQGDESGFRRWLDARVMISHADYVERYVSKRPLTGSD
jgi:glutaconate CoA-transferase subunit A